MMSAWKTKCQCHFQKSMRMGLYRYEHTLRHIFIYHKHFSNWLLASNGSCIKMSVWYIYCNHAALSMINYEIDNHDLDQNNLHRIEVQRQIPSCDIFTTINVLDLQARYVGKRNSDCIIKEVGCRTKEI